MKRETTNKVNDKQPISPEHQGNRPYWVVIWDQAFSLPRESVVEANNPEQACENAVKTANAENGIEPDEDGGFVPIGAHDRTELLAMLVDLDKHDSRRDS